ncbi:glycosyltransferase [Streptomyces sp. NPDC051133]|uniref:glycosyltransferase n=1 Tax=Streptomyces sp. NPDC051133 TaxID=3155521 RepID=UPI00343D5332
MKILHVVTLVSDDGAYGGPTSVATGQVEECAARGHQVALLSLWRGRNPAPPYIGSVPLRTRPAHSLLPQSLIGLMHPLIIRDMWRSMKRADVVHIHAGRDLVSLAALTVAALRRKKFFTQTHGMVEARRRIAVRIFDSMYVPLLRRAHGCLVLTEQEGQAVAEVVGPKGPPLLTLPNGVRSNCTETRGTHRREDLEVIFLARLHPHKRPEAFVEMAELVHQKVPDARFTLYGPDGGSLPSVLSLIAGKGLEEIVGYGGGLTHAEALRAQARASIYVLPSESESFGMAVLEALSVGTPVVCTDGCRIADELARRGAAVVTDGSPQAMADAVCELLTDAEKRGAIAEAGTRAVEESFSIRAVADRLEQIYQGV